MKYSVQVESEVDNNGTKKQYDIFTNCHFTTNRFVHPHVHSYYEMILILEGELIYQVGDHEPVALHVGDVLFVPPYVVHNSYLRSPLRVRTIVVKFSPLFLYPMDTTQSDVDYLLIAPSYKEDYYLWRRGEAITSHFEEIMRVILAESSEKKPGYELALRGNLISLYVTLVRNCAVLNTSQPEKAEEKEKEKEPESNSAQELYQILIYLKENYQYNISMQEVADVCGMSYYHFSRFFKKLTNKKFNEYLLEMRLNYAQKKLLQEGKSISEVALECGFEYVSYFIQKFKAKTGMTPKEFQKKYRLLTPSNDREKQFEEMQNSAEEEPQES